jgi:phosphodiesterase/alkaline phosphatase D-like protein
MAAFNAVFPNGVASGDITQETATLWARAAVPGTYTLTVSDVSGRPAQSEPVIFTVSATDPTIPMKVNLAGLEANTSYAYTWSDAGGIALQGNFRTLPELGDRNGLRFGSFADWEGQLAPFSAIANAPGRDLDFLVLLGDTVYADVETPILPGVSLVTELSDFRLKHSEVYSESSGQNFFAALRQISPLYATWDDHEVINDFAGGAVLGTDTVRNIFTGVDGTFVNDTDVFNNGLQAFLDYNPIQQIQYGNTGDPRTAEEVNLYRYTTFGSDAASFVLDTRSFRSAPLTSPGVNGTPAEIQAYLASTFDSTRTLLGDVQLEQFKSDLLQAETDGITWKFVMSSVPMQNFGLPVAGERWEGYAAERAEILKFITDNDIDNVVFVSADFHGNVVNNVTYQESANGPQIPTDVIDVMVGPVAYEINLPFLIPPFNQVFGAPYGPATVAFSFDSAVINSYTALTTRTERDAFVKNYVNGQLADLGYSPIGLEDAPVKATLLQGDYINAHTFGWTEFDIDPITQALTVTTYGIDPYSSPELAANPAAIAALTPTIINQFVISPQGYNRQVGTNQDDNLRGNLKVDRLEGLGGNDTLIGLDGPDLLFGGKNNDRLIGNRGDDQLYGDGGNDRLNGRQDDDELLGGRGNDLLRGSVGNDSLLGDGGNDALLGGDDDDFLDGDQGNDLLIGGQGSDTFAIGKGEGRDRIVDFNPQEDALGIKDGTSLDNLRALVEGDATLILFKNQVLAEVEGVKPGAIAKSVVLL